MSLTTLQRTTHAQDGTEATVAALQTQAAELKTMVALQTEVAGLEAQLTPSTGSDSTDTAVGEQALYEADWSGGPDGWSVVGGWKISGGMLLNDGSTGTRDWLPAPYTPEIDNYAVEAELQLIQPCEAPSGAGIVVRASDMDGYWTGAMCSGSWNAYRRVGIVVDADWNTYEGGGLDSRDWEPDTEWHTYRVEVEGNAISVYQDDALMASAVDNRYLSGDVGIWSAGMQINVRTFKVLPL
jgi:hypothetical protein